MGRPHHLILPALLASLLLAGCGGGGDSSSSTSSSAITSIGALEPGSPQETGNTATDGFNWFNFRRQQAGLQSVDPNPKLNAATQGHSDYQKANNTITHEQIPGKPGFTGVTLSDRLTAAGYTFSPKGGFAGEVISATSNPSGFNAAEDLITAIYHRFVIFDPMFKEAGSGAATVPGGRTYFTTNFAANGFDRSLGPVGSFIVYPFPNQLRVPRNFFSDNEAPDPVPSRNEVGYPISVHTDSTATVSVKSFTVRPHGGSVLPVQLLSHVNDAETSESVVAIVPLDPLTANTTYDVNFSGTIQDVNDSGIPVSVDVSRAWSFTTK